MRHLTTIIPPILGHLYRPEIIGRQDNFAWHGQARPLCLSASLS